MARRRRSSALWTHVAFVESDSEPGVEHEIKRHADGRLGCACLSYRFARGEKTCKHLRAWRATSNLWVGGRGEVATAVRVTPGEIGAGAETFTVRRAISFGAVS